ncbi:MAG: preprotein translocase subunit SecE [Thermoguttaceae bacterium]
MSAIIEEFLRVGVYKRSQGRIVRQVTFAALALTLLIGLWRLVLMLRGYGESCPPWLCYGLPGLLAVFGLWAAYRSVNWPAFADFLIAVEAEMNKVSWPSRGELIRWSVVVIVVIFAIGLLLAAFDLVWIKLFHFLGVYSA